MNKKSFRLNKTLYTNGFTLAETLVTISIFSIIMLGTTLLLKNILSNNRQQYSVLTNVDQANLIANNFVNDLRNAAYGANGAYPISQVSTTQVTFFSTAPRDNGTISKIRYYITGNTLYKGVTDPAGSPPSYTGQTEIVSTLSTNMSLGGNPLFSYYDGSYNGSGNALSSPFNINQIKFIKMNLTILRQLTQNSSATFTVNTGASIRNLKNNLGN